MISDAQWALLEPLIEACRPKGKTPPQDLRRTLSAILWRHQNGAKWRAAPPELGPGGRAAPGARAPRAPPPPPDRAGPLAASRRRRQIGPNWRAVPAELGPWWRAAQVFAAPRGPSVHP